jgi:AcrR family transcriptional regulator
MAQLRWGANAPENVDSARVRLLDAAEACFARFGVLKTTVEDVATEARVSRATVYRYFEGRDALMLGVLLRDAQRFLGRLQSRLGSEASFVDSIVEGILFTVDAVRADTNLSILFAPEAAGFTESVAGRSEALFALTSEFLRPYFEAARSSGQLRARIDLDEAAEWILRSIMSLLTVHGPRSRTAAEQRRFLLTFVVPALASDPPAPPRIRAARRQRPS